MGAHDDGGRLGREGVASVVAWSEASRELGWSD
jgi:hypothetical protein